MGRSTCPAAAEDVARLSRRTLVSGAAAASALAIAGSSHGTLAAAFRPSPGGFARLQADGKILIGTLGEAKTVNPFQTDESEGDWRCKMLYDEFVRPDPETYAATPGLAASWDIQDLVITFTIQPNAKFSDGTDVTAEDVKFTLEGFLDPQTASPRAVKFEKIAGAPAAGGTMPAEGISGIEVVDPKTVRITLAEPDAAFLYNLRFLFVVPRALLEGKDLSAASTDPFFQSPIGAGPYTFTSWSVGADFVAEANPNFWEGAPVIPGFTHRTIPDSSALVSALQAGDIDGSLYAAPTLASDLEADPNLTILVPPFASPNGTLFNCRVAPLDNPSVRRAIAMAVNVPEYVSSSLLGLGTAGLGPIAPDSWAHDPNLEPIPFDQAQAQALLTEAGIGEIELSMLCNAGNVLREDWLIRSQADLASVGITLNVEFIEWASLVERVTETRDFELIGADFAGVTAEPSELFEQFHSTSSQNHSGYANPELDELLVQARETLDQEAAKPIYAEIQSILMQDVPFHWAWYRPFIHVIRNDYSGYTGSNLEGGLFRTLPSMTGSPTV